MGHGTLTKKVLNLNRKLVSAPIDKVRRRVGGPPPALGLGQWLNGWARKGKWVKPYALDVAAGAESNVSLSVFPLKGTN